MNDVNQVVIEGVIKNARHRKFFVKKDFFELELIQKGLYGVLKEYEENHITVRCSDMAMIDTISFYLKQKVKGYSVRVLGRLCQHKRKLYVLAEHIQFHWKS